MDMLNKASEVANLLRSRYCRSDGLLGRKANCISGKLEESSSLVDEIGDYCQYIIILGERLGDVSLKNWGLEQVLGNMRTFQASDGLLYNRDNFKPRQIDFFSTIRMGDAYWGLQEVYRITANQRVKKSFDELVNCILNYGTYDGVPAYGIIKLGTHYLPLPIAEPMTSGYISESLIEMYNTSGEEDYLKSARTMLDAWKVTRNKSNAVMFLRKSAGQHSRIWGFLIDKQFKYRGRPGINENILTKGDVFLLFAWLALYRVNKDNEIKAVLLEWVEYIGSLMCADDGRFYNHYDVNTGKRNSIKLEENHSIIELLIDISYELGSEHAFDLAKRCALAWYGRRSSVGLIANNDIDDWAEIDPMLDLLINFVKLSELSGDEKLLQIAFDGMSVLLNYFSAEYGYVHRTLIDGSGPVNGCVELKYLGLLIKGLLLMDSVKRGNKLMSNRTMHLLSTDR